MFVLVWGGVFGDAHWRLTFLLPVSFSNLMLNNQVEKIYGAAHGVHHSDVISRFDLFAHPRTDDL